MAAFLRPSASETATRVDVTNHSVVLDFTVDFHSLTQFPVPAATRDLTVDWSEVERNGMGYRLDPLDVDHVFLGHYSALTPRQLEEQFLDIDLIADTMWSVDVASGEESVSLSGLSGQDEFVGIGDQGTWLLALHCTTCPNPLPLVITFLHACP